MTESLLLDWALFYAARGWPVIPLHAPSSFGPKTGDDRAKCSCRNPRCESQAKHPRTKNGLKAATTDADMITSWWLAWPDANIGLVTGIAFDVIDLDGDDALAALDEAAPETAVEITGPMVLTGRPGGVHIYIAPTGLGNKAGGRAGMPAGVDWRGAGGYVVAPPSLHHLGEQYTWSRLYGPDTPLEPAPAWLRVVLRGEGTSGRSWPSDRLSAAPGRSGDKYAGAALERICGRMLVAPVGARNDTLNAAAFGLGRVLARGGLDNEAAISTLVEAARRSGLPDGEIEATVRSGLTRGLAAGPTGRRP